MILHLSENDPLLFTETHEYVRISEDRAFIGLSEPILQRLGEVTHVELPEIGSLLQVGDVFATLDTTIAGEIELTSPLSGEITGVNSQLEENLVPLASNPYQDGWLVEVAFSEPEELENLVSRQEYENGWV
jgi:glycine cleavage system H protein